MGVRPPTNDTDDEPDVIDFGIAALDARLEDRDVSFPTTAGDLHEVGRVDDVREHQQADRRGRGGEVEPVQ